MFVEYLHKLKNLVKLGFLYFLFSVIFILFIPIWLFLIAPHFKKLPNNFNYSADILSLDNFYNESIKRFEGEKISKTIFNYHTVAKATNYLVLEVIFDVRQLNDRPIFSVSRFYYIDPYTQKHIITDGLKRKGYLFSPVYSNKSDYHYWHVNYDTPALLKYSNTEKINGLSVFKYHANYEADQTENLSYLPGVPDKRGVRVNIGLDVWIEPISGWLVKYEDHSFGYFYDRSTGKFILPWNKFSNRYTQTSIQSHVYQAMFLKWKFITVDFIVPGLLVLFSLISFWLGYKQSKLKFIHHSIVVYIHKLEEIILPVLGSALLLIITIEVTYYFLFQFQKKNVFKIGISQWVENVAYGDAIRGFKDGLAEQGFIENQNVFFFIENPRADVEKQITIIQNFINQKFDLISTLSTPGTLIAKGMTKQVPIVFAYVSYPAEMNLIKSIRTSKNNLVGSRNYISPAQQFYFIEQLYPNIQILGFIRHKGNESSEIQLKEFKALLDRRNIKLVDIAAIDSNHLIQLLQQSQSFDAIYLACDFFMQGKGGKVAIEYSLKKNIPTFGCNLNNIMQGALMGYVPDPYEIGKVAGRKASFILEGSEPAWLYTESPERGNLIVNVMTAKLLGITIPENMLQRANYIVGQ